MRAQSIAINLGPHLTTSIADDHWTKTDFEHLKCWKATVDNGVERCFSHKEKRIKISIDFTKAIRNVEQRIMIMQGLAEASSFEEKRRWVDKFDTGDVVVHAHSVSNDEGDNAANTIASYIEYTLYDIFMIMNLSSPGSCNFYNAHVVSKDSRSDIKLGLSNHNFEMAIIDSIEGNWPPVHFLPSKDVGEWYSRCRPEIKMLSSNRMERALFALFHLAKSDLSASGVIWIFYALEAIYDTRPGENFRSIFDRACLILNPDTKEAKYFNRKLRELYDVRSAFVHGGLEVVHPMANEVIDKSIEESYSRLMTVIDFGSRLVIASVQKMIVENWTAPTFREIVA